MELLVNPQYKIITPALRTVGSICTGDDVQTQVLFTLLVLNGNLYNIGTVYKDIVSSKYGHIYSIGSNKVQFTNPFLVETQV